MSPDASPGELSKGSGTRRVNNVPLVIGAVCVALFLIVIALVANDRSERQNAVAPAAATKSSGNSTMFANEITGGRTDGLVPAAAAPAPLNTPPLADVAGIDPGGPGSPPAMVPPLRPLDARPMGGGAPARDELAERAAEERSERLKAAMKARSAVPFAPTRTSTVSPDEPAGSQPPSSPAEALVRLAAIRQQASAANSNDPIAAYKARIAQVQAAGLGGGTAQPAGAATSLMAGGPDFAQSAAAGSSQDRWKLDSSPEKPRSKFELRAGFVIPATLISGINSELAGQIVAQVSQNVFDTATGKWLLIPQGARLVGAYSNNVIYGQSRVLVAWQRIVFPDGKAMDIGSMPGADSAGYSGFTDQTNNHYVRIFGSALLMSGVIAGVTYSQGKDSTLNGTNNAPTASSAMSQALGQELGQVAAQMISKNLNIAPTLEIRPGYRFNVIAVKDLTFSKPYRSFDY